MSAPQSGEDDLRALVLDSTVLGEEEGWWSLWSIALLGSGGWDGAPPLPA